MQVLIIGSGAREHALAWKIKQSRQVKKIYAACGNGGIAGLAECVNINPEDTHGLVNFALQHKIDLTVVGPEAPLVLGLVDEFKHKGLDIFGPIKQAARLEGSKVFAKKIMKKYNVPTAAFEVFSDAKLAYKYLEGRKFPLVIKADGLAAGKGVLIVKSKGEAHLAVKQIMEDKVFGRAGDNLIIEECLNGEEASILAVCDGKNFVTLVSSQDHKRINDGDVGPNTGGMGAYSPAPVVTKEILAEVETKVIRPMIDGMQKEGTPYKGVLYVGVMLTDEGPRVLEFNTRFGDPETQVVLPPLKSDLIDIMQHAINGDILKEKLIWEDVFCVCVVLASGGYPGAYRKGYEITGLEYFKDKKDVFVFHAATKLLQNTIVTDGGRVLSVVAKDPNLTTALDTVYGAINNIKFTDMHYRSDIAWRALEKI